MRLSTANRVLIRGVPALAAALMLGAAGSAYATTYDLAIHAYRQPGSLCGFPDEAAYRNRVLDSVQEANLQWEVNGISFRPVIMPIQQEIYFSPYVDCADGSQTALTRRLEWRQQVGTSRPDQIHLMLTQSVSMCCADPPDSPYAGPEGDEFPNLAGFFCSAGGSAYGNGSVWAHELGHFFCLRHTFSQWDSADPGFLPQYWDGDRGVQVEDTPGDPYLLEPFVIDPDTGLPWATPDFDMNSNLLDGHEWCTATKADFLQAMLALDDGSPHTTFCNMACSQRVNGNTLPVNTGTLARQAMSYYPAFCRGPYVSNGLSYESFTLDQTREIQECVQQVPYRWNLVDVCATRGQDSDYDGICNDDDGCRYHKNTSQVDTDNDGVQDACDLCPLVPGPHGDLDGDGVGDECDWDRDGDGCNNDDDQHPDKSKVITGTRFVACGFGTEPIEEDEGSHHDNDGVPDCRDWDDDDDGVCDVGGPLPHNDPDFPGVPPGGCTAGPGGRDICPAQAGMACHFQGSPVNCPPPWKICIGTGCFEYFLKLIAVNNPSDALVLDRFQIVNRDLFVPSDASLLKTSATVSQLARAFQGDFAAILGAGAGMTPAVEEEVREGALPAADAAGPDLAAVAGPLRLEIWSRARGVRVAVIAEYDPAGLILDPVQRGGFLALTPTPGPAGGPSVWLRSVYAADLAWLPGLSPDADDDGRPVVADNCLTTANFSQFDADKDGFGNLCDADLDGDLVVSMADVQDVEDCDGADLTAEFAIREPLDLGGILEPVPPDPAVAWRAVLCRPADLNEDLRVDGEDAALALAALGTSPGPSTAARDDAPCGGTCDDSDTCTFDYCDEASGSCVSVPATCDDFDPCTLDACAPGATGCTHTPRSCDDFDPCTVDSCDAATGGCRHDPAPAGQTCDDGDPCTSGDACVAGGCAGVPLCNDADPCMVDSCDAISGACVFAPTACDDANPCTQDACEPRSGICSNLPLPDKTPCIDGDLCTGAERCSGGQCASTPTACDDGDACTIDACEPATGGCASAPRLCDDGDPCTLDTCEPASPTGCTNTLQTAPPVAALMFVDSHTLEWTPTTGGSHWNSYIGTIPAGLLGSRPPGAVYDHLCFESADFAQDGPSRSKVYFDPPVGEAFYFMATVESMCVEGPFGPASPGIARPMLQACPTPP